MKKMFYVLLSVLLNAYTAVQTQENIDIGSQETAIIPIDTEVQTITYSKAEYDQAQALIPSLKSILVFKETSPYLVYLTIKEIFEKIPLKQLLLLPDIVIEEIITFLQNRFPNDPLTKQMIENQNIELVPDLGEMVEHLKSFDPDKKESKLLDLQTLLNYLFLSTDEHELVEERRIDLLKKYNPENYVSLLDKMKALQVTNKIKHIAKKLLQMQPEQASSELAELYKRHPLLFESPNQLKPEILEALMQKKSEETREAQEETIAIREPKGFHPELILAQEKPVTGLVQRYKRTPLIGTNEYYMSETLDNISEEQYKKLLFVITESYENNHVSLFIGDPVHDKRIITKYLSEGSSIVDQIIRVPISSLEELIYYAHNALKARMQLWKAIASLCNIDDAIAVMKLEELFILTSNETIQEFVKNRCQELPHVKKELNDFFENPENLQVAQSYPHLFDHWFKNKYPNSLGAALIRYFNRISSIPTYEGTTQ